MGSPKRLKIKDDLNYRKGGTGASCSYCNNFEKIQFYAHLLSEPRCKLIGVKSGLRYRINPNNICDRYNNSDYLKRLGS